MSKALDTWMVSIGRAADRWNERSPWTNVYGMARTVLALATMGTLLATPNSSLFAVGTGMASAPSCTGASGLGIFCVIGPQRLGLAKAAAVVLLLLAASGWRPRWTCVPHWWVAFSVFVDVTVADGGDQITSVLTLLLIPVALTDGRRWHWSRPADPDEARRHPRRALLAKGFLLLIAIQMAGLYLQAAVSKLGVAEWRDGTALYYWLHDPTFGVPGWLSPAVEPFLGSGLLVSSFTWGSLVVEFLLGIALLLDRRWYPYIAVLGMVLHIMIFLLMGLASFSTAMAAGLILYLRRSDHYFTWEPLVRVKGYLFGSGPAAPVADRPVVPAAVLSAEADHV